MEVDLNVKRNKALRVLKKHKFRPYKIRINHHLFPADFERRLEFCNWYIRKCNEDPDFQNFIIWTDESFISSDGIFNRYNNHIWSENNPHATATTNRQGRYGFSVWCGLLNDRLIGPHFFDNHLNSISYINILDNNLEQHLENIPLANRIRIYFQQDGAPAHNSRQAGEYLTRLFREKWIGTNGPIHWPPRSCDITPLDFWLWGYLKNIIYQERTNNIEELKERTRMAFQAITPVMIRNATTAVFSRCRACIAAEGRQFQHLR